MDVTLDSIVRRNLAMRKLPLHFYGPTLVLAKRGLEEMHFNTLQKVKVVTLELDPDLFTAALPVDFVDDVAVGYEVGDKVRPIGYNQRLNTKDDEDVPFDVVSDLYTAGYGFMDGATLEAANYNEFYNYKGRNFGRPVTFTDSYTILRDLGQIRIDNKSLMTSVQLMYISLPEKVSDLSIIHPYAQASLNAYINWKVGVYEKSPDQELRRRDYYNEHRILRGMLNKMSTVEIKRVVRNKFNLAIKN